MQSFLDVVLPPLLLLALVIGIGTATAILTIKRLHLWSVQRHRIENPRKVLTATQDALAVIISDPGVTDTARERALTAYQAVSETLNKEKQ